MSHLPSTRAILLMMVASIWLGAGASPRAAAADLREARRHLDRGEYGEAYRRVADAIEGPLAGEARAARLIAAEALIGLGRFGPAVAVLTPLRGDHPPARADAPWVRLLARALQAQGLALEAADWWMTHGGFGAGEREESARELERLFQDDLKQPETAYLLWKYPEDRLLCDLADRYAATEQRLGHTQETARTGVAAEDRCQPGVRAGPRDDGFFTLGVLAPLNGQFARYGIALANGADLGRRLHNSAARYPVRIEIADTGGTPQGCLAALGRLHARGVRVFIGEVFSLHTLMAAAYLRDRGALLVSPSATDTTIGLLGAGTYTCRTTAEEQAAAVIDHACDSLGVRRAALLWPDNPDGRRWANLFGRRFLERGGRWVYEGSYPSGATGFGDLRRESSGQVPDSIDALVCPGGVRELAALLSQLGHAGFAGPYLGTAELGDPIVTGVAAELDLRLVHPGDLVVPAEPGFDSLYVRAFGEEPDLFARQGWLACRLVGRAIEAGGYCPEALVEVLETFVAQSPGGERRLRVPADLGTPGVHLHAGARHRLAGAR